MRKLLKLREEMVELALWTSNNKGERIKEANEEAIKLSLRLGFKGGVFVGGIVSATMIVAGFYTAKMIFGG